MLHLLGLQAVSDGDEIPIDDEWKRNREIVPYRLAQHDARLSVSGDVACRVVAATDAHVYFDVLHTPCLLYTSPSPRDS